MPELPEVETIVAELRSAGIIGQKITKCIVKWPSLIKGRPLCFKRLLENKKIISIERRGKFILISLSGGIFLFVHLRMSGQFDLVDAHQPGDKHQHVFLRLGNGRELRYRDTRKFGRWQLTRHPAEITEKLGPEPLAASFKSKHLLYILKKYHRQIKPLLLAQNVLAGIGNIYADEALWEARLHPQRRSDSLTARETAGLYRAIRLVLRRGIRNKGTSLGSSVGNYLRLNMQRGNNQNSLRVARKANLFCRRCGGLIARIKAGQRSTYYCPRCQKLATERSEPQRSEFQKRGN